MKSRFLPAAFALLSLGLAPLSRAADAPAPTKPGYRVVLDITMNEQGAAEAATVVNSDDPTKDAILHRIAMALAQDIKQPPRLKEGQPVKFKVRVPFNFPVEDDEGPGANLAPLPRPIKGQEPEYPPALAAAGVVGGAVLELNIDRDGKITQVTVLRASHPEFGQSAEAAVRNWVFGPAMKDGVPVPSRCRTVIAYSVDGKEVDWRWRVAPRPSIGGSVVIRASRPAPAATPAAPAEKK
jgi:TonB family protein